MGCSEKVSFQLFLKFSWVGHGVQILKQYPVIHVYQGWIQTISDHLPEHVHSFQ